MRISLLTYHEDTITKCSVYSALSPKSEPEIEPHRVLDDGGRELVTSAFCLSKPEKASPADGKWEDKTRNLSLGGQ
jgi:hypothetical protein